MSETKSLDELRELVATSCRIIGLLELSNPTQGHVSARIPGEERCLIRARGPEEIGLRYTSPDDVIIVDFDGQLVEGREGLAVPLEVFIHTSVYRARPEVQSVIHIHPATAVLFTICDVPLLPIFGSFSPPALELAVDKISHYDRSILIRDPALGAELVSAMGDTSICLMRGHGITSVGRDVQESTITAIHLKELAEMNYQARLLGTPRPISDDDIATFRPMWERSRQSGTPAAGIYSSWRFFVQRLKDAGL